MGSQYSVWLSRFSSAVHLLSQVKEAKERAYKKTRGHLKMSGGDGLDDSGSDTEVFRTPVRIF